MHVAKSRFMPKHEPRVMGLKEVDSLTVYINGKEIKTDKTSHYSRSMPLALYEQEIIKALTLPSLEWYLKWSTKYTAPEELLISESIKGRPNKFTMDVENPVGFYMYLESQEYPLDILSRAIQDISGGNITSISFLIERKVDFFETDIPAIYY